MNAENKGCRRLFGPFAYLFELLPPPEPIDPEKKRKEWDHFMQTMERLQPGITSRVERQMEIRKYIEVSNLVYYQQQVEIYAGTEKGDYYQQKVDKILQEIKDRWGEEL